MSTFKGLAENGPGFFHPWSQDIFLDRHVSPEHEGICLAAATIWIEQRFLEIRGGGKAPRKAFQDYAMMQSGRQAIVALQDLHHRAIEEFQGNTAKELIAAKFAPMGERLGKSGLKLLGGSVTKATSVVSSFVTAQAGFYLIGMSGRGGGHAFAAHHQTVGLSRITIFDPNWGEATFNFENFYKTHFMAFFSSVMATEYGDLRNYLFVLRIGR